MPMHLIRSLTSELYAVLHNLAALVVDKQLFSNTALCLNVSELSGDGAAVDASTFHAVQ